MFIWSIVSALILLLLQTSIAILLIVELKQNDSSVIDSLHISEQLNNDLITRSVLQTIVACSLVLLTFFALSLMHLVSLHIYLYRNNLSTYDWIVRNRENALPGSTLPVNSTHAATVTTITSNNIRSIEPPRSSFALSVINLNSDAGMARGILEIQSAIPHPAITSCPDRGSDVTEDYQLSAMLPKPTVSGPHLITGLLVPPFYSGIPLHKVISPLLYDDPASPNYHSIEHTAQRRHSHPISDGTTTASCISPLISAGLINRSIPGTVVDRCSPTPDHLSISMEVAVRLNNESTPVTAASTMRFLTSTQHTNSAELIVGLQTISTPGNGMTFNQ